MTCSACCATRTSHAPRRPRRAWSSSPTTSAGPPPSNAWSSARPGCAQGRSKYGSANQPTGGGTMPDRGQRQGPDQSVLRELAKVDQRRVALRILVVLVVYTGAALLALRTRNVAATLAIAVFLGFVLAGFFNAAHDCV